MAVKFFSMLQCVLKMLSENRLKKNMDDTLLEKLLTIIKNSRLQTSGTHKVIVVNSKNDQDSPDFIENVIKRTDALCFIEKVLSSAIDRNENHSIMIKSFFIRFLGLIFENIDTAFLYDNLLPLLKHSNGAIISDHCPSIQDSLIFCLSCISKKYDGALWFVNQNLKDFVLSSFNSSSYYVRKSSVNFFVRFILQWASYLSKIDHKKPSELCIENFIKNFLIFITDHISSYRNSEVMIFSKCCINILNQLLESENSELIVSDASNLPRNISHCFTELPADNEFGKKLTDLFFTLHFKFHLPEDNINDVVKCLIVKGNIELAMDLASSFISEALSNQPYPNEVRFFLLPVNILLNESLVECETFFAYNAADAYNIILKKMEDKSTCKLLFSSSLLSLMKIVPQLDLNLQKHIGLKLLKISKCSDPCHKWLYSVLEDRFVHHSLVDFYSLVLSNDVYCSLLHEKTDLIFQSIVEYLKRPITDSIFLSHLLLLMKKILSMHKKYEFDIEKNEKNELICILCRALLDRRECVVDSAIHLAGEMFKNAGWQDEVSEQAVHSIIWDIAFQGNLDGTIKSTALKVVIESFQEERNLNQMKSLRNLTVVDITKKLLDLTYNPDCFVQSEALSSLVLWIKSKWNELPPSCIEYFYVGLVSAVKSLDLDLKLISLDTWWWLLENKCNLCSISPSLNINDYINYLCTSGFGLSMILAFEDCNPSVQYKAANILHELKSILINHGSTFDSLQLHPPVIEHKKNISFENVFEPINIEDRDKGIDTVMELSTYEQITSICHPISNISDFHEDYFFKEKTCTVSSFWSCLWSEDVSAVLESVKKASSDTIDAESILKDIISASIMDEIEDIPDCY